MQTWVMRSLRLVRPTALRPRAAAALVLALHAAAPFCLSTPAPLISLVKIDFVRKLSVAQIAHQGPVRVKGVVTYYDGRDKLLFIQDETAGIFINISTRYPISLGSLVEVTGVPKPDFTNTVAATSIREIGKRPLPTPKIARFLDIIHGHEDCNLVSLTGVVRSASIEKNQTADGPENLMMLVLSTRDGEIDAHTANFGTLTPGQLIDSQVRLSGVASGYFNEQLQFMGALVRIPSQQAITFVAPAPPDPFLAPLSPIGQILKYRTGSEFDTRVHVTGTVTLSDPGRELVVQSGDEALLTLPALDTPVRIGDDIEVVGYPAVGSYRPILQNARFRVLRSGSQVQPARIDSKTALSGKFSHSLVSLDARLLGVVEETNQQTLNFSADGYLFSAMYHNPVNRARISALRPESLVRVTGICVIQSGGIWKDPLGFKLMLRSPDDLTLLAEPPWWTARHLIFVLGGAAILLLAIFAWVTALRKRLAAQSLELRRAAALQHDRNHALELISCFAPVESIVSSVYTLVEHQWPGSKCQVVLFAQQTVPAILPDASGSGTRWSFTILSAAKEHIGRMTIVPPPLYSGENPREVFEVGCGLIALAVEHRQLYERLSHRSQYDALTGAANRNLLETSLLKEIDAARSSGDSLAVSFIDLDNFKQVNDEHGHKTGDIYLQHIVANLRSGLRPSDTLARWGGDEFIVISPGLRTASEADDIGRCLIESLRKPFHVDHMRFVPSASLGIALFPEHDDTCDGLCQKADQAMYAAKNSGRDQFCLYNRNDFKPTDAPLLSGNQLRDALTKGEFRLHYQPQFLHNGDLIGFEALLRMDNPVTGLVPPSGFIEAAERSGMIVPIGQWALREGCAQAVRWIGVTGKRLRMAVNVSALQFADPRFSDTVFSVLAETGLPPDLLELELTETAVLRNVDTSIEQMHRLRKAGIKFAIDDFGVGYSSLSYVHNLPIDTIKIDKSFVHGIHRNPSSLPVIRSIMSLAANLGTFTIAEGVENRADMGILRQLGCTGFQGFAFSPPLSPAEVQDHMDFWLLRERGPDSNDMLPEAGELVLPGYPG